MAAAFSSDETLMPGLSTTCTSVFAGWPGLPGSLWRCESACQPCRETLDQFEASTPGRASNSKPNFAQVLERHTEFVQVLESFKGSIAQATAGWLCDGQQLR